MNTGFRKEIVVGNRIIGAGHPIFMTAEIGLAHLGKMEYAKDMIRAAAEAGCDGVDMFMASADDFFFAPYADKDSRVTWREQSFTLDQWRELMAYAKDLNIILYPTPLDLVSLQHCADLGFPMININSDDTNNPRMLRAAASLGFVITMHDINMSLSEVEGAVRTLVDAGAKDIILLHSTQESGEEATLYASANLKVMDTYRSAFGGLGALVGCVEHTTSNFLIYAVAAREPVMISKHIQLSADKNEHDVNISVDIDELGGMVKKVRYVEMALGYGHNQRVVDRSGAMAPGGISRRKVLVADRDIPAGKVIEITDVVAKRPGHLGGLHPWQERLLIGATAKQDIPENTLLNLNMFESFVEQDYRYPEIDPVYVESTDEIQGA